ncbi:T9SS type A sorting domain-containing protein [Chryseobacterium sp. CBSDS_008]|uniref:T9SS type A sorting domain-containing protein n=1 Tax=Chryseobacterium sp. CBSDS_008 TaxID=3415265 RepID=UPI003CF6DC79
MKFNLFLGNQFSFKAVLMALFLFSAGTISFAQNRIYAHAQSSGVFGVACLGCRVDNPLNAVGFNEDDYQQWYWEQHFWEEFSKPQPAGVYIMNVQTKEGKTYSRKILIK